MAFTFHFPSERNMVNYFLQQYLIDQNRSIKELTYLEKKIIEVVARTFANQNKTAEDIEKDVELKLSELNLKDGFIVEKQVKLTADLLRCAMFNCPEISEWFDSHLEISLGDNLTKEHIESFIIFRLNKLEEKLRQRKILFDWSAEVRHHLAKDISPSFIALTYIHRTVQREIEKSIFMHLEKNVKSVHLMIEDNSFRIII